MNEDKRAFRRPKSLKEVADWSQSLAEFGLHLRDWQHEVQRRVTSRPELVERLKEAPTLLRRRFPQGDVADAYLAALAEWLAAQTGLPRPDWTLDPLRQAKDPWFSDDSRGRLLVVSPASFRQRNLFTVPESLFRPRRGRPRVSEEQKRRKAASRQRKYRERVRLLLAKARSGGQKGH